MYLTSFFWLCFFFGVQIFFFKDQYNSFFDKGGDDSYFFFDWILPSFYDFEHALQEHNPYKSFVIPTSLYLKFINYIGINSISFFHVNLVNIFFASFIPVFVYKIAAKIFHERIAGASSFFVLMYPFLNYQSTKILRDVHVYLYFTIVVFVVVSNFSVFRKFFLLLILAFLLFNVRKESVLYMMIFAGLYNYLNTKDYRIRIGIIVVVLITLVVGYSYVSFKYGLTIESISRFSQLYDELRVETDTGGSLATRLKNSGVVGKIVSVIYIWISPFPPPAIYSFNLMNFIISVGVLLWYFLFPRAVLKVAEECRTNRSTNSLNKKNFSISIFIVIILGTFLISYTSGDPRHSMVFFPVLSIFAVAYFWSRSSKFDSIFNYILITISFLAIFIYVILKFSVVNKFS
ncbi:hypothetical protein [Sediminibacterium salmoneum]|uniref:hypothetical protein n=1 Tax=Sediminibacterium salmoneum TaxID=426421 RepID=UPI00047BE27C|nr:hypothetical protein [Sediminibacterium salmoneum]